MTEMSPVGTACNMKKIHKNISFEEKINLQLKQAGRSMGSI